MGITYAVEEGKGGDRRSVDAKQKKRRDARQPLDYPSSRSGKSMQHAD